MTGRHLGVLIVALYVLIAVAMTIGFVVQADNEAARRHQAISESKARTAAVCAAENETRDALRRLARELTDNPSTLALVDRELADKNCTQILTTR